MAPVKSIRLRNVLLLTLVLCNSVTVAVNLFEATINAHMKQEQYLRQWNFLRKKGEITLTEIEMTGRKFPLYKFEGKTVRNMKVKEIFYMLQNWLILQRDVKHSVIEMDIGGETYRFRIHLNVFGKTNVLISNEFGGKVKKYQQYFAELDRGNIEGIAAAILQSSREPLNAQTPWDEEVVGNEATREIMREFMVVTQVAEAARPTEESWNAFKKIMDDVTAERVNLQSREWDSEMTKLLKDLGSDLNKEQLETVTSRLLIESEQLRELEQLRGDKIKLVTLMSTGTSETIRTLLSLPSDIHLPDEFITEVTKTANKLESELDTREQVDAELMEWDNKMAELLRVHKDSLHLEGEQYKLLKDTLFIGNEQLRKLEKLPELEKQRDMKKTLLKSLSKVTSRDIRELLNLPESVELPEEFIDKLTEIANEVISDVEKRTAKLWKTEAQNYRPRNGRIPVADKMVRRIFEHISLGTYESFRKAFGELFPLSNVGGTQQTRDELYDLGNKYDMLSDSESEQGPPLKRRRIDSKEAAAGDGDESRLRKKIQENLSDSSCRKRKKRDGSCSRKPLKVVDDSFRWEGEHIYYQTVDEDGRKVTHAVEVDFNEMASPEFTKERVSNLRESGLLKETEATGKALGVYGAAVSILASIQYFSQEEYGRGAFSAIQATHMIGGLSGVNDVVAKVTKQAVRKTVTITAEKIGLEKTLEELSRLGAKALGESTSKVLSRFAGDLPFVGLAFDAYFIEEDIKDLSDENSSTPEALKITHLVLDLDTTILTLIETAQPELAPVLEPVIIALTIIRISIDNFYLEIQDELSKVKGKGFGDKIGAFLKGFALGISDFFTLGLAQQVKGLKRQQQHDRHLLRNLSNPASYFNVTFQGLDGTAQPVGTVDFTAGILSQFGGFLTVRLNENGSFTVELPEVPTEGGIPTRVTRTFSFGRPVNDVVLGVGDVANPRYIREEAKLWLFIPVSHFDIIDGFDTHQSSQYGVYTGNSHDNNFYAVQGGNKRKKRSLLYNKHRFSRTIQTGQDCGSSSEITVHLNSYHYDLYGRGGDDRFFLGPQTSRVAGGDDNDLYFINANGGRAVIDNFAHDQEMDTLFLNVSHERIRCVRDEWDLFVSYCQDTSHVIKVRNWFSHDNDQFYRHMYLATQDGVVIAVTESGLNNSQHQVSCDAVSVDKSGSTFGEVLMLTGSLSHVKQATGSNYSDVIIGNEKPNILYGGLGDDEITGGNGSDIYLVKKGGGRETINNYATDRQEDTIIFGVPFVEISVEESAPNDLVVYASGDRSTTQVTLRSWFNGPEWQHAVFVSNDSIRFVVKENENGIPRKHPLSIDLSKYQRGVRLNLENTSDIQSIHVDAQLADEVKVILDSQFNDTIIGNGLGNILSCSSGSDILQGNGGKDTYVIDERCNHVKIENIDSKGDFDMMLLSCSSRNIRLMSFNSHLILRCDLNYRYFEVHLEQWFKSPGQRHLIVKTSDKITALLPENTAELDMNEGRLFPYQIEVDEDCDGGPRVIDLCARQWLKCERFIAKTDLCSYSIIGNELNNYIDPGPGNPFGSQNLVGNNGTDTYVMGYRYGTFNTIDNFAEDRKLDHLKLDVLFHEIEVSRDGSDATLTSRSRNDSIRVTVVNYYTGASYQHLLVHSIDGVLFRFSEEFPYIEVILADFSNSKFSQVMSAQENTTFSAVRVLLGSKVAENHIEGGRSTTKIIGGQRNDSIIGGPGDEDLIGLDGHDSIYGGPGSDALYGGNGNDFLHGGRGDDVLYGGMGADTIIGGLGSDTVVFSGYDLTGVSINLQIGLGWDADAEGDSYEMIDNILSSEYDDFLIGNDGNNVIRAYGGGDFIFPAGGDDLLQGGRGSDVYQLDNAFGHKVINNFATDEELDLIVMNQTSMHAICYYFHGDDLQLTVSYDDANSTGAVSRVILGEDFLMLTFPFWLQNSTYQHVAFSFSDGYLTPEDFGERNRQLESLIDLVHKGQLLHSIFVSGNSILLTLNGSSWNDVYNNYKETVSLQYVHFEKNSTTYYPLSLPPPESVTVSDLAAGSAHSFTLIMSSCGVNVAVSPILHGTIPPNKPTGLIAAPLLGGFVLSWNPPPSFSDPEVEEYAYVVSIWMVEQSGGSFEQIPDSSTLSVFDLVSEAEYHISVRSQVHNATSTPVRITSRTGGSECTNLVPLPSHMRIEYSARNEQGYIVVMVTCDNGYDLEGENTVICDDSASPIPRCTRIMCALPIATDFELVAGSEIPVYGDTLTWRCVYGYQILPDGSDTFSSVCGHQSQWIPGIPTCHEKPKCARPTAPDNGNVNATEVHVGESVTYSCSSGYHHQGPVHKHCMVGAGNEEYWTPSDETQCVPLPCPDLLPQAHGVYTNIRSQYVTGDVVELICNEGYYSRDDQNHPDRASSICNGFDWNPPLRQCQSIIEVLSAIEYISHVDVTVQYAISSQRELVVPESLYPQACRQILPAFTRWLSYPETDRHPQRLQCLRQFYLANGPTPYEGVLKISSQNDFAYVCVDPHHSNTAAEVCRQLGYGQYSESIYHSASAMTTTYIPGLSFLITQQIQECNYRISCRQTCDTLYLPNGNWQFGCPNTLEGEICDFRCNAGYGRIGSSSRECTSTGWTGHHPFCDGERWKTDVERESRQQSGRSHSSLAVYLRDYLRDNYPGVDWVVVVYDDVTGFQKHTVAGHFYNLWRHYGHNIVVGKKIPNSSAHHDDLDGLLRRAYSPQRDSAGWGRHVLNAERTNAATWDRLVSQGVYPTMLLIFRDGISYGSAWHFDSDYIVSTSVDYGYATLIV